MTMNNGSNIKKAGQLMKRSISRLPYIVYILQLTVGKGLNLVRVLVLQAKRLIDFFNISPKQRERLHTAQEFLRYTSIKHVIRDVSTWEHLIELKRAIKFLPGQLKSDLNKDAQKDGEKLEKIILSDNEWKLYMPPKLFWTAVIISKIPNSIMASQIILALYIVNYI
ncbi:unnamed protein product [Rhizophagus irregularis]|nr:unnamed protein product [Rhizophagus irregularis]